MALITYLTRIQSIRRPENFSSRSCLLLVIRRPLIVTDKGVDRRRLWARVKEQLPGNMPAWRMYDGTAGKPERSGDCAIALKIYKGRGAATASSPSAAARRWISPMRSA